MTYTLVRLPHDPRGADEVLYVYATRQEVEVALRYVNYPAGCAIREGRAR